MVSPQSLGALGHLTEIWQWASGKDSGYTQTIDRGYHEAVYEAFERFGRGRPDNEIKRAVRKAIQAHEAKPATTPTP